MGDRQRTTESCQPVNGHDNHGPAECSDTVESWGLDIQALDGGSTRQREGQLVGGGRQPADQAYPSGVGAAGLKHQGQDIDRISHRHQTHGRVDQREGCS